MRLSSGTSFALARASSIGGVNDGGAPYLVRVFSTRRARYFSVRPKMRSWSPMRFTLAIGRVAVP